MERERKNTVTEISYILQEEVGQTNEDTILYFCEIPLDLTIFVPVEI